MTRQFFITERVLCNGCFGSGEQSGSRGGQCFTCKGERYVDKRVSLLEALAALGIIGNLQSLQQRLHTLEQDIDMEAVKDNFGAVWGKLDAVAGTVDRISDQVYRDE